MGTILVTAVTTATILTDATADAFDLSRCERRQYEARARRCKDDKNYLEIQHGHERAIRPYNQQAQLLQESEDILLHFRKGDGHYGAGAVAASGGPLGGVPLPEMQKDVF